MTQWKNTILLRVSVLLFAAIFLTAGLSGCGKKSALTPPDDSQYPKQYPRQ